MRERVARQGAEGTEHERPACRERGASGRRAVRVQQPVHMHDVRVTNEIPRGAEDDAGIRWKLRRQPVAFRLRTRRPDDRRGRLVPGGVHEADEGFDRTTKGTRQVRHRMEHTQATHASRWNNRAFHAGMSVTAAIMMRNDFAIWFTPSPMPFSAIIAYSMTYGAHAHHKIECSDDLANSR